MNTNQKKGPSKFEKNNSIMKIAQHSAQKKWKVGPPPAKAAVLNHMMSRPSPAPGGPGTRMNVVINGPAKGGNPYPYGKASSHAVNANANMRMGTTNVGGVGGGNGKGTSAQARLLKGIDAGMAKPKLSGQQQMRPPQHQQPAQKKGKAAAKGGSGALGLLRSINGGKRPA